MISDHLCECGCGAYTNVAEKTHTRSGNVKGQPYRYIAGHSGKQSDTYHAVHVHLQRKHPKSGTCEQCGKCDVTEWAVIHGRSYSRNRDDYRELCKKCHRRYDLSQLDWEKVAIIQSRNAAGESARSLAREYGVDWHTIGTALTSDVPVSVVESRRFQPLTQTSATTANPLAMCA